ncbi:MAG: cysteine--tRNA ligase [Kiritimatiellae bacterium]|nr:cysteine--tRNA ligase [Kiritimatiellia bacterium]
MEMKVYNSLARRVEPLEPLANGTVRLYTCGPTVYNFAHIGNFRAYTFEDILRRVIQFNGMKVRQVMNLTDVDDKTIRGANAAGVALTDYTKTYKDAFFADLKKLNIQPAEVYPAATDHIPEMIALVEKLVKKGVAYKSDDGSVYFAVTKFPGYGKLAHIDFDHQRTGARCAADEYDKENVGDFALWKAWEESDGPVGWDSPWGRGRPGWHIECSAMSMKYLGETFDLHTGGIDNLFPHHENEIAQAEAATGKPFVKTWMHCAHLRVNGEKMSKSLGNFFTLRDLLEKGWSGREIRYVLVNAHYRQGLNFAFSALEDARKSLERIDRCVEALMHSAGIKDLKDLSDLKDLKDLKDLNAPDDLNSSGGAVPPFAVKALEDFTAAVNDDLNIPRAFASLFDLVRHTNAALTSQPRARLVNILSIFRRMDEVLGVIFFGKAEKAEIPAEIQAILDRRAEARKAKDWAESDRLRDELAAAGWAVKDSKDGQAVTRK